MAFIPAFVPGNRPAESCNIRTLGHNVVDCSIICLGLGDACSFWSAGVHIILGFAKSP